MKKGFTLVEIIVCIVLITLIGTVVTVNLVKKEDEDKIDENISNTYATYLEGNDYFKAVLEQQTVVYIKFSELIKKGLIDEEKYSSYKDKCYKLFYEGEQNLINIVNETDTSKCDEVIVLKKKPKMKVETEYEMNSTNTCYKNFKLKIEVEPNDNKIEKLSVRYKINGGVQETPIVSNLETEKYAHTYDIVDGSSDVEVILKTDYNDRNITVTPTLPEAIVYDKYNSSNPNIIKLENNKITKIAGTNNIKSISASNGKTTIDDINENVSTIDTIDVEDKCGHTYNYTIKKDYTYKDYVKFTDIDVNYWGSDYQYYYRFSDGSILYNYYVSSCRNDDYWCYNNSLKIYNPLTKKEFILYDSYNSSDDEIKHNIKVSKIDETKYRINVETDYSQPKDGYAYKYYEEYEYDISKEEAIKEIYRVYKRVGAEEIFSSKKNYCKYSYQFYFLVPSSSPSKEYWENDKTVSFGSSASDFCIKRSSTIDSFDNENNKYMEYKNDFDNTTSNTTNDDYGKVIDTNNSKLITAINNYATKSNTGQKISGTYSSSSLHSFIRNKVWENDELIVVPFACRLDSDEDYSECFLNLNKSLTLNLISTN